MRGKDILAGLKMYAGILDYGGVLGRVKFFKLENNAPHIIERIHAHGGAWGREKIF